MSGIPVAAWETVVSPFLCSLPAFFCVLPAFAPFVIPFLLMTYFSRTRVSDPV